MSNIEKDLDIFPTTYAKDFRWFKDATRSRPYKDIDAYAMSEEEKTQFLITSTKGILHSDPEYEKEARKKEMQSMYTVSYCMDYHPVLVPIIDMSGDEDKIMDVAAKLYGAKTKRPLMPLPTSRRAYGYSRLEDYRCGLSEYQGTMSKLGYALLKAQQDRGLSRTGPRVVPPLPDPIDFYRDQDWENMTVERRKEMWR